MANGKPGRPETTGHTRMPRLGTRWPEESRERLRRLSARLRIPQWQVLEQAVEELEDRLDAARPTKAAS